MVSPEEPDGVELALHLADESARAFQAARRQIATGVVFVMEPTKMPYGGIDAVFDDTCGNLLDLHQD